MTDDEILARAGEILEARAKGRKVKINDTKDGHMMVRCKLAGRTREEFCALWLDAKHRVIAFEQLFLGSVCNANVSPRELAWSAFRHNAASVILAHNHPSGDPEPSKPDRMLTERLTTILSDLDVKVLDHIVVGSEGSVSMAERGLM